MALNVNQNVNLGVIGCGKMASAIMEGIYKNNFLKSSNIFVYDKNDSASANLAHKFGFNQVGDICELLNKTNVILIATKPFVVNDVLNEIKKNYNNQLVMSILAGVKIEKYEQILNNAKIIRIMPNTPALVNEGMSAVCAGKNVDENEYNFAFEFMKNCGKVIKTNEDKIDAITALSGSGPAFYFKIIELMAKAGIELGLNNDEALLLSTQTALGSAKMIFENDYNISQLIQNVTTPGGCTEVGNNVLNDSNIDKILSKTISDTAKKAKELG